VQQAADATFHCGGGDILWQLNVQLLETRVFSAALVEDADQVDNRSRTGKMCLQIVQAAHIGLDQPDGGIDDQGTMPLGPARQYPYAITLFGQAVYQVLANKAGASEYANNPVFHVSILMIRNRLANGGSVLQNG
jgi:hypothetical protein